ncbi:MAG: oxygen-independent coproporphyrinogen III oxidase [Blastomonas sp.]
MTSLKETDADRGTMECMWYYHPDLLARPVPRYTSFPTAAEFAPLAEVDTLEQALGAIADDEPVSLYVHIPYCEQICWYCGCNTGRVNRRQRLDSYLDALMTEIDLVAARLGQGRRICRIVFGGGSPNALAPVEFVRLFDRLATAFQFVSPQVSIEIDPRGFGSEWTTVLSHVGASHASLGVQTLDPAVQAAIGRIQPLDIVTRAVGQLRDAGIRSLNFDLMYGLPHQDISVLEATLQQSAALRPERVSLFGYAHVPQVVPRQKRIDAANLPDMRQRFDMAALGHHFLVGHGYMPIGFDHFALPCDDMASAMLDHRLNRNFQGFTDDRATVTIGLGASAISSFPDLIVQNEKNAGRYRMWLSQSRLPTAVGVRRSEADRRAGAVIRDLLCYGEADLSALGADIPVAELEPFVRRSLAMLEGNIIRLGAGGWPYARAIAACFDPYRNALAGRFSSAV